MKETPKFLHLDHQKLKQGLHRGKSCQIEGKSWNITGYSTQINVPRIEADLTNILALQHTPTSNSSECQHHCSLSSCLSDIVILNPFQHQQVEVTLTEFIAIPLHSLSAMTTFAESSLLRVGCSFHSQIIKLKSWFISSGLNCNLTLAEVPFFVLEIRG